MTDLPVRNMNKETKRLLAIRAAQNGRSQQDEALEILKQALAPEAQSWLAFFVGNSQCVGGFAVEAPTRHAAREFDFFTLIAGG